MSVTWIWCVFLVLIPSFIGVGGQYCDSDIPKEKPAINMCQERETSVAIHTYVYLDVTGAPNFRAVECLCDIIMTRSATVNVIYRSTGNTDCGIKVEYGHNTWACTSTTTADSVTSQAQSQIKLTKPRADKSDWSACIGLMSNFSSLEVKCYQHSDYTPPVTSDGSSTTTEPATSSTTTTTTTTAPTTTTTTTTTPPPTTTTTPITSTTTPTLTTTPSDTSTTTTNPATTPTSTASSTTGAGGSGDSTSTESTSAAPPTAAAVEQAKEASVVGPVVGGVIAFLVLVVFIVIIVCLIRRRRRRKKEADKIPVSFGPRSVRYSSMGDDVQVTENELYNYDGEQPSEAVNALFIGGIPDTPGANPSHIPHFTTDTGDRYAVIDGSTRTKKPKERPSLSSFGSNANGNVKSDSPDPDKDTDPLGVDQDDDKLPHVGVDNIGYDSTYLSPKDASKDTDGGARAASGSASSGSPYDYIDNAKLQKDDEAFEKENQADDVFEKENQNHYVKLPGDKVDEPDNERYKKFITTSTSSSTAQDEGHYNEI